MMGLPLKDAVEPSWQDIWVSVQERVRLECGQGIYDTWIAPLSLLEGAEGQVKLSAPGRLVRDYVTLHHAARLERAFSALTPDFESLDITVAPESRAATARKSAPAIGGNVARQTNQLENARRGGVSLQGLWDRQPDPSQSFENFVVGPETEFAFKAAQRFAESSENDMGLLFVHGGFGYGKTHLLNAIAIDASHRSARVLFLRAEDFMRRFLGALRNQETLVFKEELRGADVLLIDDLQHICGRAATVSEFLHTVNAFTDLRRRVVIAADRPPAALEGLSGDVRSRMQGAMVIALQKPDVATRLEILRAKSLEMERKRPRASLPEDVLSFIATELDVCPRELLGVLVKLATYADLTGKPVTRDVAEEAINSRGVILDRPVTIEEIQKKTAEFYKLDLRELHSVRRARRVARPRQVAMYLARELTSRSLPDIGRRFGGRDHTTVLHACRRIEALCGTDPVFQQEVDFLRKLLGRAPRA